MQELIQHGKHFSFFFSLEESSQDATADQKKRRERKISINYEEERE